MQTARIAAARPLELLVEAAASARVAVTFLHDGRGVTVIFLKLEELIRVKVLLEQRRVLMRNLVKAL